MTTPPIIQGSPVRSKGISLAALAPVFVTVFLITVIIATAVTFILPESYASTARIKVENVAVSGTNGMAYDPYFIQTEFDVLQSQLVLQPVIAQLNLNVKWGKKYFNGEMLKINETMEILKGRLSLAPIRGTKLIEITVYNEDRNEAAQIANAIVESYQKYSIEKQSQANAVQIIDRAEPGRYPVKPNKPVNIALGALFGIILGGAAAALVGLLKSRS